MHAHRFYLAVSSCMIAAFSWLSCHACWLSPRGCFYMHAFCLLLAVFPCMLAVSSWLPLKGIVSPDYICLEVISIKSPLLGHVIKSNQNQIYISPADTMLLQIFTKFLTFPLIFNGPSKFLSILHQTHSNSPIYWNMNSVNTRSIPNYTKCIPGYTRYIPKVSEMLQIKVGTQTVLH